MNKKQREELQDRARYFNGMFAKWRKERTDDNYKNLEESLDSLTEYWLGVKNGET